MQTRLSFYFLLAIAALAISSCNKSNEIGRYIPKNASVVVHVNAESLTSKMPWNEVKQNQLFQEIYTDTAMNAVIKAALDNPENTGIDTKNDLTFFIQKDSLGGYIALQGKLKDADKFKTFYTNVTKGTIATDKEGVNAMGNDKMNTTWNKERFVVVFDAPQMNEVNLNNMKMPGRDSTLTEPVLPSVKRNLQGLSALVFNLEEKNSLAKDEKFSDLLKSKGDVHFWMNAGEIGSQASRMPAMSMMNMSKLYEGSIISGTATFLDGKIDMDLKYYASKEMSDLFKKYEGSKMSSDMVKRIPAKDIAVLFAMNFKPQGILEFLKLAGLDGFANMGAGFLGFTLDDFVKANKGDILLTVSDMTKDSVGKIEANYLFSVAINDKAAFGKLIDAGKKAGKSKFSDSIPTSIFYSSSDKYFAIGNKQATVDTYVKTESNASFDFFDKISGSPMGLFVNFQYVMRAMVPTSTDSLKLATHNASLLMWDNLLAKGGEFKDGGIIQHVEINLVDKKMNSLKQLNNYFGILGTIEKKKKSMSGIEGNVWMDNRAASVDTSVVIIP